MLYISGCYYDVEEELYPSTGCDLVEISYANDIIPILEKRCYSCHNTQANFGNVTLEGFIEISKYTNNGSLIGSIKHIPGFSAMPKNQSKLIQCEIEKIETWINDGALNN